MNNLTPEQRVDKNGRLVTRHVKTSGDTSTTSNKLPAPSVASHPTKEHQALVEDTARGIEHSIDSYVDEVLENDSVSDIDEDYEYFKSATRRGFGSLTAITNSLNDYSEDTLQRLQSELMMDNGFRNNDFGMVMAHALRDKADEQQVRNYTALYGRINDIYRGEALAERDEVNSYIILSDTVAGTKHYQDIGYDPPEDMFNATDEEIENVVNLGALSYELEEMDLEGLVSSDITLDMVKSTHRDAVYAYVVKDKELVKLVLDHPEDNLAIFDLMWEKHTANPTLLASIMYSETPALSDGVI